MIVREPEKKNASGFTLLEIIIVMAILSILTATTIPVARNLVRREKERELRRNLREIRQAIDAYHIVCSSNGIHFLDKKVDDDCYPPTLETLVEGVHLNKPGGLQSDDLRRFLRRIPKDPFTDKPDWGMRSSREDPDSSGWDGKHVYDVYSNAPGTALNGKSQYKDW